MHRWFAWGSIVLLSGCAAANIESTVQVPQNDVDVCRRSVDDEFARSIVAPVRSTPALCKVGGGVAPCRGNAAASVGAKTAMMPLTSHEADGRRMFEECMANRRAWAD